MPITPNFVKALKGIFAALIVFYLIQLVQQFTGTHGISLSSPNSLVRVLLNQFISYAILLVFWIAIFFITKDKIACIAAVFIQTIGFVYIRFLTTSSANFQQAEMQEMIDLISTIRMIDDILCFGIFGLLHFRSFKGLFLPFAWLIVFGITSGPAFTSQSSYFNSFLKLLDLDRLLIIEFNTAEGRSSYIDLLRPLYSQLYLLFDLIIFWFVYAQIKAGKRFDPSLRTIQLNPVINQMTFSLVYWPLRILLFIAAFGMTSLLTISFQREMTITSLLPIAAGCFSIFVVGSVYRNFLTDYLVSKGRSPGWLFWLLNIPILSFFAWIYTFFIPTKSSVAFSQYSNVVEAQDQSMVVSKTETPVQESPDTEDLDTMEASESKYDGPDVYYIHPLQTNFAEKDKNSTIKILLIFFSTGLLLWQFRNTSLGFVRPDSGETESPIIIAVITLALTIWYLYDWKALMPLFFIQSFGILSVALFQMQGYTSLVAGAGLVNMMIYYSLFHFDHLKLISPSPAETEATA